MENNFDQGMQNNMFASNMQGSNVTGFAEAKESLGKNLGMAAIAGVVGTIVGFIVTLILYKIGFVAVVSGLAGMAVAFVVYLKLAKDVKIAGMAIITLLMMVGIYFGMRVGTMQDIQAEFEDAFGQEISYSEAVELHDLTMELDDSYKFGYYKNIMMGEIFAIGGCVAVVSSRMKKAR